MVKNNKKRRRKNNQDKKNVNKNINNNKKQKKLEDNDVELENINNEEEELINNSSDENNNDKNEFNDLLSEVLNNNNEEDDSDDDDDDDDDDSDDDDDDDDSDDDEEEERDNNNIKKKNKNNNNNNKLSNIEIFNNDINENYIEPEFISDGKYHNKQRVLVFCSRGVTSKHRHFMDDLRKLIPHNKREVKFDGRNKKRKGEDSLEAINLIADVKSCNNVLFLEARKKKDLYLWLSKTPHGPSIKFHVLNIHTMDELKLTGNCLLGSRPLLSFDNEFNKQPHWLLIKSILIDVFGAPRGHPKTKPFIDRIMSFYVADNRIWVRNYQILDESDEGRLEKKLKKKIYNNNILDNNLDSDDLLKLIEIGPRFVLNPSHIFEGSFGGSVLYKNEYFLSPNELRSIENKRKGQQYMKKKQRKEQRKIWLEENAIEKNELNDVFR